MRAATVGLLVEEQRSEIAAAWKRAVGEELEGEPALGFAVAPLLREMALALRADGPVSESLGTERVLRSAVLVRSGASPARLAREFKLLHRAIWNVLRATGRIASAEERRVADEWLDEALAATLDRQDRVRTRIDLLGRGAAAPPPLERRNGASERPPPLPPSRTRPPLLPMPEIIGPLE